MRNVERECPKCGELILDDRLVRCPLCKSGFTAKHIYQISPEQEHEIYVRLIKKLKTYVFGSFSIIGLISLILMFDSLKSIYDRSTHFLNGLMIEQVGKEFQEPRIKATVDRVAAEQAKSLLDNQVRPQVEQFQATTAKSIESIRSLTTELEGKYKSDYSHLATTLNDVQGQGLQVKRLTSGISNTVAGLERRSKEYEALNNSVQAILRELDQRMKIVDLAGKAITDSDHKAFTELEIIAVNEQKLALKQLAASEILRVKSFYISGSRTVGMGITKDGKDVKASELDTCEITLEARTNQIWSVRALLVQELGQRKQIGVPEAILVALSDSNLVVVKSAVDAWQALTGFKSPDVLDAIHIVNWWKDHQETFSKDLAPAKCK